MVLPTTMMLARSSNMGIHMLAAFLLVGTILNGCSPTYSFSISSSPSISLLTQRRTFFSRRSSPRTTSNNVCSLDMSPPSSADDDGSSPQRRQGPIEPQQPDYNTEETLLKIQLATQLGVSTQEALQAVATYSQSFPFSTVLPLKPLMHMPTSDQGVEVKFLRRGGGGAEQGDYSLGITDGGIRFFVKEISVGAGGEKTTLTFSNEGDDDDDDNDDDDDVPEAEESGSGAVLSGLELTVKRNSVGQSTSHGVAERALVTAYLSGLTGIGRRGGNKDASYGCPPTEQVYVTSFYHKWMLSDVL